jgi:hypothetical protein
VHGGSGNWDSENYGKAPAGMKVGMGVGRGRDGSGAWGCDGWIGWPGGGVGGGWGDVGVVCSGAWGVRVCTDLGRGAQLEWDAVAQSIAAWQQGRAQGNEEI